MVGMKISVTKVMAILVGVKLARVKNEGPIHILFT